MLRILSVTVAAATVALVSAPSIAGTLPLTAYSERLVLSPSFIDQGRNLLTAVGGGSIPAGPALNTVDLPVTDSDFTATATGDFVPGTYFASYSSGFRLTRANGSNVEFRNLFVSEGFNLVSGDIIVNGALFQSSINLFTFADSVIGKSFQDLALPQGIYFTALTATTLNTTFGLTNGNQASPGGLAGTLQLFVPEPTVFALFGLGFGLIAVARRRAA